MGFYSALSALTGRVAAEPSPFDATAIGGGVYGAGYGDDEYAGALDAIFHPRSDYTGQPSPDSALADITGAGPASRSRAFFEEASSYIARLVGQGPADQMVGGALGMGGFGPPSGAPRAAPVGAPRFQAPVAPEAAEPPSSGTIDVTIAPPEEEKAEEKKEEKPDPDAMTGEVKDEWAKQLAENGYKYDGKFDDEHSFAETIVDAAAKKATGKAGLASMLSTIPARKFTEPEGEGAPSVETQEQGWVKKFSGWWAENIGGIDSAGQRAEFVDEFTQVPKEAAADEATIGLRYDRGGGEGHKRFKVVSTEGATDLEKDDYIYWRKSDGTWFKDNEMTTELKGFPVQTETEKPGDDHTITIGEGGAIGEGYLELVPDGIHRDESTNKIYDRYKIEGAHGGNNSWAEIYSLGGQYLYTRGGEWFELKNANNAKKLESMQKYIKRYDPNDGVNGGHLYFEEPKREFRAELKQDVPYLLKELESATAGFKDRLARVDEDEKILRTKRVDEVIGQVYGIVGNEFGAIANTVKDTVTFEYDEDEGILNIGFATDKSDSIGKAIGNMGDAERTALDALLSELPEGTKVRFNDEPLVLDKKGSERLQKALQREVPDELAISDPIRLTSNKDSKNVFAAIDRRIERAKKETKNPTAIAVDGSVTLPKNVVSTKDWKDYTDSLEEKFGAAVTFKDVKNICFDADVTFDEVDADYKPDVIAGKIVAKLNEQKTEIKKTGPEPDNVRKVSATVRVPKVKNAAIDALKTGIAAKVADDLKIKPEDVEIDIIEVDAQPAYTDEQYKALSEILNIGGVDFAGLPHKQQKDTADGVIGVWNSGVNNARLATNEAGLKEEQLNVPYGLALGYAKKAALEALTRRKKEIDEKAAALVKENRNLGSALVDFRGKCEAFNADVAIVARHDKAVAKMDYDTESLFDGIRELAKARADFDRASAEFDNALSTAFSESDIQIARDEFAEALIAYETAIRAQEPRVPGIVEYTCRKHLKETRDACQKEMDEIAKQVKKQNNFALSGTPDGSMLA